MRRAQEKHRSVLVENGAVDVPSLLAVKEQEHRKWYDVEGWKNHSVLINKTNKDQSPLIFL